MLTRQPNPRTRAEVREDPQEPATRLTSLSLTNPLPPPPPELRWLRPCRPRVALPLLLGQVLLEGIDGAVDGLAIGIRGHVPAGPVALPPSTPPSPGPAAPRTAVRRAPATPVPPRLYCFFSELPSLKKFCMERLTCAVSGSDEQLARAIILVPGFGGKARRSCSCLKQ
jgi:hypothetical protein